MKTMIATLMIALATLPGLLILLSAPSSAQFRSVTQGKQDSNADKKKVDDSQYKAAVERMPEKKFDPWRDLR